MEDWKEAFAEQWDAVVLGTGMKECLLSGLLSVAGKKVLHLDRNPYYGGASASLTMDQLFKKFGVAEPPSEAELGKLRDYNIDLVPKFIMAGGLLVKVLIHTGVSFFASSMALAPQLLLLHLMPNALPHCTGGKLYGVQTRGRFLRVLLKGG